MKPLSERFSEIIGIVNVGRGDEDRDVWHEVAALEARIAALERNAVERKHIDATPDEDYPLRILRAYRADCNMPWSTMTDEQRDSPLTQALNALQGERMVILDRAIAALAKEKT